MSGTSEEFEDRECEEWSGTKCMGKGGRRVWARKKYMKEKEVCREWGGRRSMDEKEEWREELAGMWAMGGMWESDKLP